MVFGTRERVSTAPAKNLRFKGADNAYHGDEAGLLESGRYSVSLVIQVYVDWVNGPLWSLSQRVLRSIAFIDLFVNA